MLVDGSFICVKNAGRLTKDAKILFDEERYSACLSLAVLALEELGKAYMLIGAHSNGRNISSVDWNKNFRSHTEKLKGIINYLSQFSGNASATKRQPLQRLSNFLIEMSGMKLESFYVDWDHIQKQWRYFDDQKTNKKELASEILKANSVLISTLIDGFGGDEDLKFLSGNELVRLLLDRRVYGFCNSCGTVMMGADEYRQHLTTFDSHAESVTWYHTPVRS